MHELSIAQGIVTSSTSPRGRRIVRVNVEIGAMAGVAPDAVVRLDLVTDGTCAKARGSISLKSPRQRDARMRTGFPDDDHLPHAPAALFEDAAARRRA